MAENETSGSTDPQVLDEQGILLFHLQQITKDRSQRGFSRTKKDFDVTKATLNYKNSLSSIICQNLPNVCLIDTKKPSTFLNLLKTEPKFSDLLLRMSTFELSSLVPLIRLFKIFYNPTTKEETILEIPFDTSAKGIDQIYLNSAGRGQGAGITSVEWKQNPKNEASVASFKVALNMHLQSIEDLVITRSSTTTADGSILTAAVQDLLYQRKEWRVATNEGPSIYNPDYYTIKLVIGWEISDSGLESLKNNTNRADIEDFLEALKNQKEVLYLHFTSHNIEFNEDGSVDLQANYIGRADSTASDIEKSNILNVGKSFEKDIEDIKNQIKSLEEEKSNLLEQDKSQQIQRKEEGYNFLNSFRIDTDAKNSSQESEEKIKELKEKLENLKRSSKMAKYNYLLTRMFQKNHLSLFTYDVELIKLISSLKGIPSLAGETDLKNFEEYAKRNNAIADRIESIRAQRKREGLPTDPWPDQLRPEDTNSLTVDAREAIAKATNKTPELSANPNILPTLNQNIECAPAAEERFLSTSGATEETIEGTEELYELASGNNFTTLSDRNVPRGKKRFAFFYLSSLIEAAIEPILNNNPDDPNFINKKLRVILGPMTIIDYGSIHDNGKVYRLFDSVQGSSDKKEKYVKVYEGKQTTINIGDVPISVKEFQRWFNEHIVNKNVEQMTFNEFISLIVNDLVLSAITNQVYTYAPRQKARVAISNFTSIAGERNESAFAANIANFNGGDAGGFRIDQTVLESLRTKGKNIEKDHNIASDAYLPSKDYCVVYCMNDSPYDRVGDYLKDKEDGILHLYAGESKGVIRSLKFSRIDNPNRRADNMLAATSEGKGFSKIIRERYNVTIEMFGNTNLQAGTYIFLSPTLGAAAGVGLVEKALRDIGLGGYYLITEVNSSVEIGDFKTTIKGVWSAFGDGTVNDGDKEYAPLAPGAEVTKGTLI